MIRQKNTFLKALAVGLCIASCSIATYNPTNAVEYAKLWCAANNSKNDGTCSPYKIYTNTDCANFVSQCLIAGGLDLSSGVRDACGTIPGASNLGACLAMHPVDYFFPMNKKKADPIPTDLSIGDVIIFNSSTGSNHATIVVDVTGGIPYLAAHTSSNCHLAYNYMFTAFSSCQIHHYRPPTTGITDFVRITSGTRQFIHPGGNVTYTSAFIDQDHSGTGAGLWDWSLKFDHAAGTYQLASASNLFSGPSSNTWTVLVGALPTGYDWQRNDAGLVTGLVTVHTVDSDGDDHSASWNVLYSTPPQPAVPQLSTPLDLATDVPTSATLTWSSTTGATSYRVQGSQDQQFGSLSFDRAGVTGTSSVFSNLATSTTYYWRVNAKNNWGSSFWSVPWSFKTKATIPAPPQLSSPSNGATGVSQSPTLQWNSVAGATSYRVQVARNTSFSPLILDQAGITGTTRQVSNLVSGALYYWRVNASNSTGTSSYSSVRSFTTLYPQSVAFQNQTISTAQEDVKAHATITMQNDQFSSGASISLKAGTNIDVGNNVTMSNGSKVNLVVDPALK